MLCVKKRRIQIPFNEAFGIVCVMWRRYVKQITFCYIKIPKNNKRRENPLRRLRIFKSSAFDGFVQVDVVPLGFEAKENVDVFRKYSSS